MDENKYQKLISLNQKHLFPERFQQKVFKDYIKEVQKELSDFTVSYDGNSIHIHAGKFKDFNVKVKFDKDLAKDNLEDGFYYYGENAIYLNPELLKDRSRLAAVISHEAVHVLQAYYIQNEHKIDVNDKPAFHDYVNMLSLYMDSKPIDIDCLNFKDKGNVHYEPQSKFKIEDDYVYDLSMIFYTLHISEADAYRIGEQEMAGFCNYYNGTHDERIKVYDDYNVTKDSIPKFMDRYNLNDFTDDEVMSLYNRCFLKINLQQQPESELEANVMYDMACLALYNYRIQQDSQIEEYEHEYANGLISNDVKKSNLRQYGFDFIYPSNQIPHIVFNMPLYASFMADTNDFLSKDKFFRKDNISMFLWLAPMTDKDITEDIPDMELLKQMCIADREMILNSTGNTLTEGVKIIFGEDFLQYLGDLYVEDIVNAEVNEADTDVLRNDAELEFTNNSLYEENIEI